jgi:protoheme IX farnesyltransferase
MKAYWELSKPRIAFFSVATGILGFAIAGGSIRLLFWAVAGLALVAGACGALNQGLEGAEDARMRRTAARPVPSGRVAARSAIRFGAVLAVLGLAVMAFQVNRCAFWISAASIALYAAGYTPLKKMTPQATWLGCAAGAAPPLIGWAAARGSLAWPAWLLFGVQFLWQIPHFLAVFWIHREDYARAGFRMMPAVDPSGRLTAIQIAIHSFGLLPLTLIPFFGGAAGIGYALAAMALGLLYLPLGLRTSVTMSLADARRLFLASLAYLPAVYGLFWYGVKA